MIDQLNIGRTASYKYFPPDRIKELRNEHLMTESAMIISCVLFWYLCWDGPYGQRFPQSRQSS